MSRAGSSSGAMYTSRILILFECRQSYYCTEECTHKKPFSANLLLDYRSSSLIDKTIYQSWKIHWVARRLWLHSSLVCLILIKRHGNTTGGRTRRFRVKICVTENPYVEYFQAPPSSQSLSWNMIKRVILNTLWNFVNRFFRRATQKCASHQ